MLGLEKHQALIVAHNDKAHRHVHVIVNRVDLETGKAAHVGRSRLLLSEWAEEYERRQGRIRCNRRELNNERRAAGARLRDRVSLPTGRYRRGLSGRWPGCIRMGSIQASRRRRVAVRTARPPGR